jgi:hypothetical protein
MNKIKINKPPIPTFCGGQKNFIQNPITSSLDYFKTLEPTKNLHIRYNDCGYIILFFDILRTVVMKLNECLENPKQFGGIMQTHPTLVVSNFLTYNYKQFLGTK